MHSPRHMRMRAYMVALVLMSSGVASADVSPEDTPGWRFDLQPYAFLPLQVTGDVSVGGMDVPVDVSVDDLFDSLELAGMVRFEAWNRRFGLIVDSEFVQTGQERTTPGGVELALRNRAWLVDLMAAYRVSTWRPSGPDVARALSFEISAGARIIWLGSRLEVGPDTTLEADHTNVLGLVGARIPYRISERWMIGARADFGFPGPQLTVTGGADWNFTQAWALKLAYRVEWIKRTEDDPEIDLIMHGPYLGVGYSFGAGRIY